MILDWCRVGCARHGAGEECLKLDAHVFIDNSNVFGGAQRAAEAIEPGIVRKSVRVYYKGGGKN